MHKRLVLIILTVVLALVVGLSVLACNNDNGGGSGSNKMMPTLSKVKIIPVVNGHNGDEAHDVCLEVMTDKTVEMFDIEVSISNPDNASILSLNYNGTTIDSKDFGAESNNKVVYIKNNRVPDGIKEHLVTIDEIRYQDKSGATGKVKITDGNAKMVRVSPTFKLTFDLSGANIQEGASTTQVVDNVFMSILKLPLDDNMNDYIPPVEGVTVYGTYGYIFAGWYTEKDGQGTRISANSLYSYYHDITLYAHYARAFTYTANEEFVTITGITEHGKNTNFNIEIPNEIDGLPVRKIGANAFTGVCAGKTVILPNTIVEIGDYAFMNCEGMQIDLATTQKIGKMAFANCGKLVLGADNKFASNRIGALPATLRQIGDYAFRGTSWDTSIVNPHREMYFQPKNSLVIPQTVTHIGAFAFTESLFEQVYFESNLNLATIGVSTFEGSKSLKAIYTGFEFNESGTNYNTSSRAGLTEISDRMFYGCTNLVSTMASPTVKLNEGLTKIGDLAFASSGDGMVGLQYVAFPNSLQSIGKQSFANTGLTDIRFTEGSTLISIGEYAFENSKFESITIYSLATYGKAPFWGNTSLKAINILTDNVPAYTLTDSIWGSGLTRKAKYYVKKELLSAFRSNTNWREDGASDYVCAYDYITSNNMQGTTICFEPVDQNGNLDFSSNLARITSVFDTTSVIRVPSTFTYNSVDYTVVSVGKFFIHDEVTKVYLPSTLKTIEDRAFYTCKSLYEIVWRSGLVNLTKHDNKDIALTTIGDNAFNGTSLTYFYSNKALTSIGKQAFHNSKSLSTVVLEYGTALTIMGSAFSQSGLKTLVIGHNVKSIYDSAFQNNTELSIVLINLSELPISTPDNYPNISPFRDCSGLSKILLFSNNAMANFTAANAPNGENNTYANIKKSDGITSAYEKYVGTWSEALDYYNIY